MAKAGDRMTSVHTGETFVFIKTAANTDGQQLVFDMICEPGGGAKGAPTHIHPKQEEHFHIRKGVIEFEVNGRSFFAYPGESITVPAGTPHTWRNPSQKEKAVFRCEIEPAGHFEFMFESLCGLSQRGMIGVDGSVSPLAMARILHRYPDHLYIVGIPFWEQRLAFALLSPIAKLMGYKELYTYQFDQPAAASIEPTHQMTGAD
ncbi:MAG: cupin domain-containing protein [Anaerolineae bacterium]|nr:cupin domain-containing protein [Anaerolineae bacterium]